MLKNKTKKVLIIKLGAIGDVVHSTVICSAIKSKHPDWEVHYLTQKAIAPIIRYNQNIDRVISFKVKHTKIRQMFSITKKLFKEHYDIIFCLSNSLKNYIPAYLSFPKKVVLRGYKGTSWVENYFYTAKSVIKDLELPDRLYLNNDESRTERISKDFEKHPKPHIMINPGKIQNNPRQGRVWNIKKWQELSKSLIELYGGTIFVNGSSAEKSYHEQLESDNVIILSGKYNLADSCTAMSLMDIMISGDSGPAHIAAAYGVNTVAILGSTSPDKIKPFGKNGYIVEPKNDCRYCWQKKCKYATTPGEYPPCIESISTDDVLDTIRSNKLLTPIGKNNDSRTKSNI